MILKHLAVVILALVTSCPAAFAQGDVVSGVKATNSYFKKRPTQKHAILSTGECAAGIAFSANPAGAAAVGIPVLALGNLSAYLLRNAKPGAYTKNDDLVAVFHNVGRYVGKHPTLLQDASGSFCLAYGLTRTGRTKLPKPQVKKPQQPGDPGDGGHPPNDPPPGNGGNGGGNGGGSGDGGSGGGNGGSGGGNGGCQQDCGLGGPNGGGNGGVNGGNDGTKKPPFPGRPHRPGA